MLKSTHLMIGVQRGDSSGGQQDVGEGVATRGGVLSLRSFSTTLWGCNFIIFEEARPRPRNASA